MFPDRSVLVPVKQMLLIKTGQGWRQWVIKARLRWAQPCGAWLLVMLAMLVSRRTELRIGWILRVHLLCSLSLLAGYSFRVL